MKGRGGETSSAVLLVGYGAPERLGDVPAFLSNIRAGREVPPGQVDRFVIRYRKIGGGSPFLSILRAIAVRLERTIDRPVYLGMHFWTPYIREVVKQMVADGHGCFQVISIAPHYSRLSVGKYLEHVHEALGDLTPSAHMCFVRNWHDQPAFISGLAQRAIQAKENFSPVQRGEVRIIFSAHSLPKDVFRSGDPYVDHIEETATLVAGKLGLDRDQWTLAYQSASREDGSWLGPDPQEVLLDMAEAGQRSALVVPIGFVVDNLEVLFDIDIELQNRARELGIHMERSRSLNDSPATIAALSAALKGHLLPVPSQGFFSPCEKES